MACGPAARPLVRWSRAPIVREAPGAGAIGLQGGHGDTEGGATPEANWLLVAGAIRGAPFPV